MPVILRPGEEKMWLSYEMPKRELLDVLRPYETAAMRAYEVSTLVNRASVDIGELIRAV
jgi:putative SOS response-associated peptidase YedK